MSNGQGVVVGCFVLVVGFICLGIVTMVNNSRGVAPAQVTTSATLEPFTVDELKAAFRSNPVKAKDHLRGRFIAVTGRIEQIANDSNGGDSVAVVLRTETTELFSYGLTFWFQPGMRYTIGELSKGQTVTIEAQFKDQGFFTDDLTFDGRAIKPIPTD